MSAAVAEFVIAALPAEGSVEVTGEDELAAELRSRLRERINGVRDRVGAAVDTTGDPALIAGLLTRLADLGTLVLAGPPAPEPPALDLYADLHVRGLTVVGIAPRPRA
jgi:D-arabinose 1-dehydrogenase-like Zn-dependent alcohol dehydrogenase